jgi:hypothetical protein
VPPLRVELSKVVSGFVGSWSPEDVELKVLSLRCRWRGQRPYILWGVRGCKRRPCYVNESSLHYLHRKLCSEARFATNIPCTCGEFEKRGDPIILSEVQQGESEAIVSVPGPGLSRKHHTSSAPSFGTIWRLLWTAMRPSLWYTRQLVSDPE